MRYISLFSGVEAASVAWAPLGWEPLAFCEVDEFPSAVLATRFPDVPNLGDVTKVDWEDFYGRYGAADVLIGGSPCQSFSIAGNREGLKGESGLMFEYIRAIRDLLRVSGNTCPRYILWENVPGALSSERGNAFGQLLAELDECGYGLAWRVLDAQFARVPGGARDGFFGPVAQRRRRVFLVGVLGSPHAAEILFERSCLSGDHPKGREAREALAEHLEGRSGMGDSAGFKYHQGSGAGSIGFESEQSPTITADYHNPAIMFRGDTTPKVSEDVGMTLRVGGEGGTNDFVLTPWDVQSKRVYSQDGTSPCLQSGSREGGSIQPIVMTTANTNANGSNVNEDGACYTLDGTNSNAVAFAQNTRDEVRLFGGDGDTVGALAAQPGMKQQSYVCMSTGSGKNDHCMCQTAHQNASGEVCMTDEMAGTITAQSSVSRQHIVCMSSGQANAEVREDGGAPSLTCLHESPIVAMADDNGKAAVDEGMCGSLKVGGGAPLLAMERKSSGRSARVTTRGSGASL